VLSLVGLAVLGAGYLSITFAQVWWNSNRDEAQSVDAIVVLGAAQFDGVPSPVLAARLDRALELYRAGHGGLIVTTGSKQSGDRFTEAYAGLTYLLERGVPESDILVVVDGTNTFESLSAAANALGASQVGRHVLLVSDPYHALRAKEIAREVGLDPEFSPSAVDSSLRNLSRETAAVAIGRIVGFRRVSNLSH
jgi:uncharacterized SAM-binding protein YcdF (DUF218 family)